MISPHSSRIRLSDFLLGKPKEADWILHLAGAMILVSEATYSVQNPQSDYLPRFLCFFQSKGEGKKENSNCGVRRRMQ